MSVRMNNFENHRTDTEYEDALILKSFAFRFINNYSPLFYIAFVKPSIQSLDPCTNDNCLKDLQTGLGSIFISKLMVNLLSAIISPILDHRKKVKTNYEGNLQTICYLCKQVHCN